MNSIAERPLHDRSLLLAASAIDSALTTAETAELESHLLTCPACRRRAAALQSDAATLAAPLDLLPSRRVDDAVHAAISRPAGRFPRDVLLAVAALALLVALLGVAAVGAYLWSESVKPPLSVAPLDPPVSLVSPGPDASAVAIGDTWQTIDVPGGPGSLLEAVTLNGADVVSVGRGGCVPDFSNPTTCYGAAWVAPPGQAFEAAPDQPGLEMGLETATSGPEKGMFDVAAGPAGLVAIGYDYNPPRSACAVAPCPSGPAVWRSTDGRTWERAHVDLGPSAIDTFIDPIAAISAGPDGYVMVGHAVDYAAAGPNLPARATAWASRDGVAWTRAIDSDDMDVGPCVDTGETPDCGGMNAVVATGSGFAAVGEVRTGIDGQPPQPAAWTSQDGLTWTRAAATGPGGDETVNSGGFLSSVAAGGPGLVAAGTDCQPDCTGGIVATSVDGSSWTITRLAGTAPLTDVAATSHQVFALGAVNGDVGRSADVQLWRSDDGVAWQRVAGLPSIPEATLYRGVDLAAASDRLIVAGWADGGGEFQQSFAYTSP